MYVYAGIDEAGYGPMFGPLLVSRAVVGLADFEPASDNPDPPDMWQHLAKAVCRKLSDKKRRIPINDSKKLHTPATGIKHLETGVLSFAALAGHHPATVDQWLDCLGETCHRRLEALPWYQPTEDKPWANLPVATTAGELAITRSLLARAAEDSGVQLLDIGADVVLEDRFNQMVAATRSKAATSFTFVTRHLASIWECFGHHQPVVVVDRQSGRTRYRELLAMSFPDTQLTVLDESPACSAYRLESPRQASQTPKVMTVRFEVDGDGRHMPVALASMISKYTRELLMFRFKAWFQQRAPQIKPTAGYGRDAKRFWQELEPVLASLSIRPEQLRRQR
jgi:hypothetical protein